MPPLVYIVDDDAAVRSALALLIRGRGWRAVPFESARAFLDAEPDPDEGSACLLIDLHLPGMNGLELQEQLCMRSRMVPTIFMTAHPDGPLAARVRSTGADPVMGKPLNPGELMRKIGERFPN